MKNPTLRHFDTENPIVQDIQEMLSNKTKIARSAGIIYLTCPVCGVNFERKASEAKRHDNSYCGVGCAGLACRRQVLKSCVICEKKYTVRKSVSGAVTCCSKECRSKRLSNKLAERNKAYNKRHGSDVPGAKLTDEDVIKILRDKRSHKKIADDYGVSRPAISMIKRGETWKHIDRPA